MKKALWIWITVLLLLSNMAFAATEQDVINALNASYTVGGEQCRFPQSIINKGMEYINSKNLSSKQCDKLLGIIGTAVSIAQKNGTTDITKIPKEDLKKLGITSPSTSSVTTNQPEVINSTETTNTPNPGNAVIISGDGSGEIVSRRIFGEYLI